MRKKEILLEFYKIIVGLIGSFILIIAVSKANFEILNWNFVGYMILAILIGSRADFTLPQTKITLSFSDSMTYLAFLLYGGEMAVIVAVVEIVIVCLIAKSKGALFSRFSMLFNIGSMALSTVFAYGVWTVLAKILNIDPTHAETTSLISSLGIFSLSLFFPASIFAAFFYGLKKSINPWQIWKRESYSISLMQIVSAALAGIIYKAISLENPVTIIIALIVMVTAYLAYRRSNNDITRSLEKAEQAEREKTEAEKLRAEQAEKHIDELNIRLAKEEEISEALQQSVQTMEYIALHDSLTDVFNRFYLIDRLNLLLEIGINKSNQYFVLFLDLSGLKNINDSLGHNTGDEVLKLVAKRLLKEINEEDTVARIGGDEFAVIFNDLPSVSEAENLAKRIYEKLCEPFSALGNLIFIKPYIGIAALEPDYQTPEEILRDADIAMHEAKNKQTGIAVFNAELRERFLEKIRLETDLRLAIERRELCLYYQPIISLADGLLSGFEALLRWRHPRRGFISPAEFIPIAEDSGLIIPITDWILRETTRQLAEWQKISLNYSNLIVSVNISGKHFVQDGLVEEVKKALAAAEINPSCLKLEITETVAMEYIERTTFIINSLKQLGVQISIDDFGTGYSSLSYLHNLSFDNLKIDRSFVNMVGENGENTEILQTIIALARNLKMQSIAEGIETVSQLKILRDLNCDYAQGFLLAKPQPKEDMETMLYQKGFWLPEEFILPKPEIPELAPDNLPQRLPVF